MRSAEVAVVAELASCPAVGIPPSAWLAAQRTRGRGARCAVRSAIAPGHCASSGGRGASGWCIRG
eukprot:8423984-Pyramimonas_sp.AAC.1